MPSLTDKLKQELKNRNDSRDQSFLEKWVIQFLKPANIYDYILEYQVDYYFIDIAWPNLKYGVELDGLTFHKTDEQKEKDRKKDAYLIGLGWKIKRITSYDCWRPSFLIEHLNEIKTATKNFSPYGKELLKTMETQNMIMQKSLNENDVDYTACDRCGDSVEIGKGRCRCAKWIFD